MRTPPAEVGSIPGLGRSPREGNSNPLRYSCLGKSPGQRGLLGYSPWGSQKVRRDLVTKQEVIILIDIYTIMSYNNGSYVPGTVLSALGMLSHRILPATLGGRHDCCPEDAGKDSTGRGWEELWLQSPPLSSWADPPESMRTTATPDAPFPGQRFPKASYTGMLYLALHVLAPSQTPPAIILWSWPAQQEKLCWIRI